MIRTVYYLENKSAFNERLNVAECHLYGAYKLKFNLNFNFSFYFNSNFNFNFNLSYKFGLAR